MSRLQGGGQINVSDINVELRRAWNAPFNLQDGLTRQLAQSGGGPISFSQFYGKQLYPDYGTYLGEYCYGTTHFWNYADGNGGFYQSFELNAPSCGYVPPPPPTNYPPAGQFLYSSCDGYTLLAYYTNGGGGSYSVVQEYNSPSCGFYSDPGGGSGG